MTPQVFNPADFRLLASWEKSTTTPELPLLFGEKTVRYRKPKPRPEAPPLPPQHNEVTWGSPRLLQTSTGDGCSHARPLIAKDRNE